MKVYTVEIEVPATRVVDLFVSACEGGSNYWCTSVTPNAPDKGAYEGMIDGFKLTDGETGKTYKIFPKAIAEAMHLFPVKAPQQFSDFLTENDDAATGDCFLQLCVFKEVIYG